MADGENQDGIMIVLEGVEREITGPAAGDHEFVQTVPGRAADQGMTFQYRDGFRQQADGFGCRRRVGLEQEVGQSFEVGERP